MDRLMFHKIHHGDIDRLTMYDGFDTSQGGDFWSTVDGLLMDEILHHLGWLKPYK